MAGQRPDQRLRARHGTGGGPTRRGVPQRRRLRARGDDRRRAPAQEPGNARGADGAAGESPAARLSRRVLDSHPDNDTRLQEVVRPRDKVHERRGAPRQPRRVSLARIDGLPMGNSRAQGIVRGSRFYHGDMGMTVAFPTGWLVENQRAAGACLPGGQGGVMEMTAQAPPPGMAPKEFLGRMLQGVPTTSGEPIEVNGLQGYTAMVRSTKLPWGNQGPARDRGGLLQQPGLRIHRRNPAGRRRSAVSTRCSCRPVKTFRRLRDNEFPQAEPDRIRSHPRDAEARRSSSWRSIADQEVPGRTAAAAERPVPGQGADAGPEDQDRGIVRS